MAAASRLAKEQQEWFDTKVSNAKSRKLFEKLGLLEKYRWPREISEAAKEAGLDECAFATSLGPIIPSQATLVSSQHLAGVDDQPIVAITADAISVDGKAIVQVRKGSVDPLELEGGALGIKIMRLSQYSFPNAAPQEHQVRTFQVGGESPLGINIFAEPETPYRLLFQAIASLRSATPAYRRFSLLVASKEGTLGSLPIVLPEHSAYGEGPETEPVMLIVTLTKERLLLWSVSGLEGTLEKPAFVMERDPANSDEYDFAKLSAVLAEIVERRWPNGGRTPEDFELLIMANGDAPYRTIAELVSVTQTTPSGEPYFTPLFAKPSLD